MEEYHIFDLTAQGETHKVQVTFSQYDYIVLSQIIEVAHDLSIGHVTAYQQNIFEALNSKLKETPSKAEECMKSMQFCNKYILSLVSSQSMLTGIWPTLKENQV